MGLAAGVLWAAASGAKAAEPAKPPVPAGPQQTTATFGDWTLRCNRAAAAGPLCEVVQSVVSQDHPVAEFAFGHIGHGQPMHMTIVVPPNVSFGSVPMVSGARTGDPPIIDLVWRRCLPGGCFADAAVPAETMARLRSASESAQVHFADAAGHVTTLPFSPRGLAQALDALAKEEG